MSLDLSGIDFAALEKGSVISAQQIVQATGIGTDSRWFPMGALQVREAIERYFREERGLVVSMAQKGDDLRILTDSEASSTESKRFHGFRRRMTKAHRRMVAVDHGQLSFDEQEKHRRELLIQGAYMAAMHAARRTIRAETSKVS
jgi:hypothetical protein